MELAMRTRSLIVLGCTLATLLPLGACDSIVYSGPSAVTTNRAEVYQDEFTHEMATGALSEGQLTALSNIYWGNGDGPVHLSVSYDPRSKSNTAKKARDQASKMTTALKNRGMKNVQSEVVAEQDSGTASRTSIRFNTLNARPPADCPEPMGMNYVDQDHGKDYKLGCSVETYTARQIARPKDLLGNDIMDNNDGRRNANMLETYRSGAPNEELKGTDASEN
jgi:type IV pilus biogenesis protein CpaD/CtpE